MFLLKDILIPNFVQNAFYVFDYDKNKEFIKLEILPKSFDVVEYKMLTEKEIYNLFLNYFEFDKNNDVDDFDDLIKSLLLDNTELDDLDDYIYESDIEKDLFEIVGNIEKWIIDYLKNYKKIVDKYPVFYLFYPRIWKILRYIVCSNNLYNGKYKIDLDTAINEYVELYNEIHYLTNHKDNMRQEILDIFNVPSEHKVKLPTSEIALIYQAYNGEKGIKSTFNNLNPFIRNINNHLCKDWEDVINKLPTKLNAPLEFPECDTVTKFLRQVTELLIHNEYSIRLCKNCDRYFIVRYSSLAEYCSRLVEDTSSTCQEYASKKTYKKKQAKNPLYQAFTTYYNRIYGRIRRGSLDKESSLLDDIKLLHQEFSLKYDSENNENKKKIIIDDFISSAEQLIIQGGNIWKRI